MNIVAGHQVKLLITREERTGGSDRNDQECGGGGAANGNATAHAPAPTHVRRTAAARPDRPARTAAQVQQTQERHSRWVGAVNISRYLKVPELY